MWNELDLILFDDFSSSEKQALSSLNNYILQLVDARSGPHPRYDFSKQEIDDLLSRIHDAHVAFGGSDRDFLPIDADVPRQFSGTAFLRSIEANAELLNVTDYIETMLMRIKTILADVKLKSVICDGSDILLSQWLEQYVGGNTSSQITIIDLSLLPSEVVCIITAVIARMIFEALQRFRKTHPDYKTLPTVLVMEEAHTFVKRYSEGVEDQNSSAMCCKVFEKIAREGRKFGLGLVLSSQRPSELSPTVLSQCNTFLLHRISNDRDQELVHRLLPDNLQGLLRELPTLPSRNAILLGWASELPVLVRMRELPMHQRPQSDDPDFWDVWTGTQPRTVDWGIIADDWQESNRDSEEDSISATQHDVTDEDNTTPVGESNDNI